MSHRIAGILSVLAVAGLAACAAKGSGTSAAPKSAEPPAWELQGTRIIGCCCSAPCSCRINHPPMQEHGCEYTTAVRIDRGHIGGVRMDGIAWAQIGLGFAKDPGRNWVIVYVSDRATDAQFKTLQNWMAEGMKTINERKLKYLAGAFAGFKKVPMAWEMARGKSADDRTYTVRIPGVLDLKVSTIFNPGHPEPVMSSGVMDDFGNSFVHAETIAHGYKDASLNYDGWDLSGRQSNWADFHLASNIKTTYPIGWGCWSGHADWGSQSDYVEKLVGHPKK